MTPRRRKVDKCVALRLYERATPYVQMAGWASVMIGMVFSAMWLSFSFISDSQAYENRIAKLEEKEHQQRMLLEQIGRDMAVTKESVRWIEQALRGDK